MKKIWLLLFLPLQLLAQENASHQFYIPDIQGYKTLKCIFQLHMVTSHRKICQELRVEQALIEGLDSNVLSHFNQLLKKEELRGIEIIKGNKYQAIAFKFALKRNLTMLGNFNIQEPEYQYIDVKKGELPPLNFVFVKEKTEEGIHQALKEHRTVVWFHDSLFGKDEYIIPLVKKSIQVERARTLRKDNTVTLVVKNTSDLNFIFKLKKLNDQYTVPEKIAVKARSSVNVTFKWKDKSKVSEDPESVEYEILNILIAPKKRMQYIFSF